MKIQDKQALERYRERLMAVRNGSSIPANETREDQRLRIERAKKDVGYFVATYLKDLADCDSAPFQIDLANKVLKDKTCRYLVRWGRGLAKSVWCDVIIPLWLWVNGEDIYMVIVGNTEDKACILLSDVQAEFEANQLLIHDFGEQKLGGSWTDGDFSTRDSRFRGMALGMGQSPRGLRKGKRRPNLIVADDLEDRETAKNPMRQDEIVKWIERDLILTMDGETRRYLHPNNDPWPRSIQNQLELKHPKWNVHLVEAYNEETFEPAWKAKYSTDYYKYIEDEDIGSIAARAEYNHKKHVEGKIFTDDMIQWGKAPALNHFAIIVGFWDVAYSGNNDYNAVKVWGLQGRNFWQLKAFVRQCKMVDAIRFMYDYQEGLPPTVIVHWRVESQFWNDPLRDALKIVELEKKKSLNLVIVERPRVNKYDRILTLHPYYQNGRIYYDERERANNDTQVGIAQLKGIEPGYKTNDDSPDADEQAINILGEYVRTDAFEPRIVSKSSLYSNSKNRF